MTTLHVDIVSAEKELYSGPAEMVIAPGECGEIGILPRHSQLLTRLKPGQVKIKLSNNEEQLFYVSGGLLEVQPRIVTILSDSAERAKDLDEAVAQEAKMRAEKILSEKKGTLDYAKAKSQLSEAIAQLQTIEKLRKLRR